MVTFVVCEQECSTARFTPQHHPICLLHLICRTTWCCCAQCILLSKLEVRWLDIRACIDTNASLTVQKVQLVATMEGMRLMRAQHKLAQDTLTEAILPDNHALEWYRDSVRSAAHKCVGALVSAHLGGEQVEGELGDSVRALAAEPINAYFEYMRARFFVQECDALKASVPHNQLDKFERSLEVQRAYDMELRARNRWLNLVP